MWYDMECGKKANVITMNDLEGFSDELREQVRFMQERWNA